MNVHVPTVSPKTEEPDAEQKFKAFARGVLSVKPDEIREREAAWQAGKEGEKKRGPKRNGVKE